MRSFYNKVFKLLHHMPQQSAQAIGILAQFEQHLKIFLPQSVHEWFSFADSPDIMRKIALTHTPINTREIQAVFDQLNPLYAATAPSSYMLPVLFENQGVWHIAVSLDGQDDPSVYLGYQGDNVFKWHLHADHFSDFIYAWSWDYVIYERDYSVDVSMYILPDDLQIIRSSFEQGPTTYEGNGYLICERFERYSRGDKLITLIVGNSSVGVWFTAESAESLQSLLQGPWSQGDLLACMGTIDLEKQKGFYGVVL